MITLLTLGGEVMYVPTEIRSHRRYWERRKRREAVGKWLKAAAKIVGEVLIGTSLLYFFLAAILLSCSPTPPGWVPG
jgi:hypothetical protein